MDIVDTLRSMQHTPIISNKAADEIVKLRHEVHELKRTRSEAEANARIAGYKEGIINIISQLKALSITVNIKPPN